jgi:uncharacterized membrane protein
MLNIYLSQSMMRLTVKLLGGVRDIGLQSLLVMISLFISWITLLEPFKRHLHLHIKMIGKKRFIVRWTQLSQMELER